MIFSHTVKYTHTQALDFYKSVEQMFILADFLNDSLTPHVHNFIKTDLYRLADKVRTKLELYNLNTNHNKKFITIKISYSQIAALALVFYQIDTNKLWDSNIIQQILNTTHQLTIS